MVKKKNRKGKRNKNKSKKNARPTNGTVASHCPRPNRLCSCAVCGASGTMKCCECKTVFYCGRECQLKHWESHMHTCPARLRKMMEADTRELLDVRSTTPLLADELGYIKGRPFLWEGCVTPIGKECEATTLRYLGVAQSGGIDFAGVGRQSRSLKLTHGAMQAAIAQCQSRLATTTSMLASNKGGQDRLRRSMVVRLQQQLRDAAADGTRFNYILESFKASSAYQTFTRRVAERESAADTEAREGTGQSFDELLAELKNEEAEAREGTGPSFDELLAELKNEEAEALKKEERGRSSVQST